MAKRTTSGSMTVSLPKWVAERLIEIQAQVEFERCAPQAYGNLIGESLGAYQWYRENITHHVLTDLTAMKEELGKEREEEVSYETVIAEALECLRWNRTTKHDLTADDDEDNDPFFC